DPKVCPVPVPAVMINKTCDSNDNILVTVTNITAGSPVESLNCTVGDELFENTTSCGVAGTGTPITLTADPADPPLSAIPAGQSVHLRANGSTQIQSSSFDRA